MLTNRYHFWRICILQRQGNALIHAGEPHLPAF